MIGLVSAIGALSGVFIDGAFRQSFLVAKNGTTAMVAFLVFYAACFVVTWVVYLRPASERSKERIT